MLVGACTRGHQTFLSKHFKFNIHLKILGDVVCATSSAYLRMLSDVEYGAQLIKMRQ